MNQLLSMLPRGQHSIAWILVLPAVLILVQKPNWITMTIGVLLVLATFAAAIFL